MACIAGLILRRYLPTTALQRIYLKHRGLEHWRELRAIYARHGVRFPLDIS